MKRLLFILTILLFTANNELVAQEIVWYNWAEGYQKAKDENKIILLDAYTEWCGWCKVMDQKTYSVKEIQGKVYKNFVAVKLNPEVDGTYKFAGETYSGKGLIQKLSHNKFRGYPTTFFVFPNSSKSYMEIGYIDAKRFLGILNKYVKMQNK